MMTSCIRRSILGGLATWAAAGAVMGEHGHLFLENDHYRIEVDPANGAIARVFVREAQLEVLPEPRLADNFRFTLPLHAEYAWQATEGNFILGKDQRLTSHALAGSMLRLKWGGPMTSISNKPYDVSAEMTIQLIDKEVRFTFRISNRTPLEIGEVYYPILGGSLGLGSTPETRKKTELVVPGTSADRRVAIYQTFSNFSWLGVIGPEQYYSYPDGLCMPWVALHHRDLGRILYFGAHDPVARYKVVHLEMLPGIAGPRPDGNWPREEELEGLPAGVKICFVQMPYQPAGEDFVATPVVLRVLEGDVKQAARIYGQWRQSQSPFAAEANWLERAAAIQECQRVPFADLPDRAKAAAEVGIKALVLKEWTAGDPEDGLPSFEPNPNLGTREELAAAVQECHALGVKVALVMQFPTVSRFTNEYDGELHQYASVDRWGIPYTSMHGRNLGSLTGGWGNAERRAALNPGHPGLRNLLVEQLRDLAALGIDGIEVRGFFRRPLDFNPTTGTTPDRATWEGGLATLEAIRDACRSVRPGFAISTDALWDGVLGVTRACAAEVGEGCLLRDAFPSWRPSFVLSGEESTAAVNRAICDRGQLRIKLAGGEPLGESGLDGAGGYARAVLSVRDVLGHTLVDGRSVAGRSLSVEGPVRTVVFRHDSSGLHTAVLVNEGINPCEARIAGFTDSRGKPAVTWQPAHGARAVELPIRLSIPARQIAILTEEQVLEELSAVPQWKAAVQAGRMVFDFRSPADLAGWKLKGSAFSVGTMGDLVPEPTLNSIAAGGESAIGSALSPAFTIEERFDQMEFVLQGGWSRKAGGEENLFIRVLDAENGDVLAQVLPPGHHALIKRRIPLDPLKGRAVRLELIDRNTDASFAWIGIKSVALIESTR
ncbi:MAG: hypothetical protein AMXMBFR13_45200 [Phycisphaerae bacterium]